MVKKLTIEDIRNKILKKDFQITYAEAINLENPSTVDYRWVNFAGGKVGLIQISIPVFGNVSLKVVDE